MHRSREKLYRNMREKKQSVSTTIHRISLSIYNRATRTRRKNSFNENICGLVFLLLFHLCLWLQFLVSSGGTFFSRELFHLQTFLTLNGWPSTLCICWAHLLLSICCFRFYFSYFAPFGILALSMAQLDISSSHVAILQLNFTLYVCFFCCLWHWEYISHTLLYAVIFWALLPHPIQTTWYVLYNYIRTENKKRLEQKRDEKYCFNKLRGKAFDRNVFKMCACFWSVMFQFQNF